MEKRDPAGAHTSRPVVTPGLWKASASDPSAVPIRAGLCEATQTPGSCLVAEELPFNGDSSFQKVGWMWLPMGILQLPHSY